MSDVGFIRLKVYSFPTVGFLLMTSLRPEKRGMLLGVPVGFNRELLVLRRRLPKSLALW